MLFTQPRKASSIGRAATPKLPPATPGLTAAAILQPTTAATGNRTPGLHKTYSMGKIMKPNETTFASILSAVTAAETVHEGNHKLVLTNGKKKKNESWS